MSSPFMFRATAKFITITVTLPPPQIFVFRETVCTFLVCFSIFGLSSALVSVVNHFLFRDEDNFCQNVAVFFVSVSVVSHFLFRDEDNFCQNVAVFFVSVSAVNHFLFPDEDNFCQNVAVFFVSVSVVSHFLFPDEHNFCQNVAVLLFCCCCCCCFCIRVESSFYIVCFLLCFLLFLLLNRRLSCLLFCCWLVGFCWLVFPRHADMHRKCMMYTAYTYSRTTSLISPSPDAAAICRSRSLSSDELSA